MSANEGVNRAAIRFHLALPLVRIGRNSSAYGNASRSTYATTPDDFERNHTQYKWPPPETKWYPANQLEHPTRNPTKV